MKTLLYLITVILITTPGCSSSGQQSGPDHQRSLSPEAKAMLNKLGRLENRFLIAHQDATSYGVTWNYTDSVHRCDILDVCGDYPAVYGFDIGHIELDHSMNLDSVDFNLMSKLIREAHARGGLITISWHLDNPVSGGGAWDTIRAVEKILPGGDHHARYVAWVECAATFLNSLRDDRGVLIPVFFRPFHEMSGDWFWWGSGHCSPSHYQELWKETVHLLYDVHHLDNLLFVYSTDRVGDETEYLTWYPGDEWVDLIGIDFYDRSGTLAGYTRPLSHSLAILKKIGASHRKPYALTETGYETIPDPGWWTSRLLPALQGSGIAWVLLWRNDRPSHHYAPYPGHPSAPDFIQFADAPETVLGREWAALNP